MDIEGKHIEFAPQDRLSAVEELASRFFREVLEYEYEECLVSDESDLYDFTDAFGDRMAEVQVMLDRLEGHYLIDDRGAGSTRIVDLLEFLRDRGVTG
jgi:hypothetical protein